MARAPAVPSKIDFFIVLISKTRSGGATIRAGPKGSFLLLAGPVIYDVLRPDPAGAAALELHLRARGEYLRILIVATVIMALGQGKLGGCLVAKPAIGLREI